MVDVDSGDQRIQFFKKHSKSCVPCQRKLRDIEKSLVRFEFFVPAPRASAELKNEFHNELPLLFKNIGLSPEAKSNQKRIAIFDELKIVVRDIETVLNNKKFIAMALVLAGASFGLLSLLLK